MIRCKHQTENQIFMDQSTPCPTITARRKRTVKSYYTTLDDEIVFPDRVYAALYENRLNGGHASLREMKSILEHGEKSCP